ncbi:MAG: serine--tRNA ligase [Actinobacteria bacterium]|nr:serine--tRNA ligase [Actinomycetota bacterium]
MIDLKLLRSDPDSVRESLRKRGSDVKIDALIELDARHRELLQAFEAAKAEQNLANKKIAESPPDERDRAIVAMRKLSDRIKVFENNLNGVKAELDRILAQVPNLVDPAAPDGAGDESNVVLRQVGDPQEFDFTPRDHLAIGELLDVIDMPRAVKVSGTRFGLLKGDGAILEMSLMRFALDRVAAEGFVPCIPPVLVRGAALFGTGFFPFEEEEAYAIPADDLYLAGTSEVALASMHAEESLNLAELPRRYSGFSSCFRREAGTYGKDTRGIIRLHQFEKVEMFSFTDPERSQEEHEKILGIEESLFQALEVPYRVVDICAGDLGAPYSRKFDIEAWLPGAARWLEVTSCSNALDYQARRLGIRTRVGDENIPVHTLNGTALTGRAIVSIFENHQQEDGSVVIPEALRSYTGFEAIKASHTP